MLLLTSDITKTFEGENVIEKINICINEKETVSLLGRSGVGKTTFFNVLSGLTSPDEGKILLNGKDITGKSGYLGYMQQKDLLLPFKTVLSNVCLPLILKGMKKKDAIKKVLPLLERFGLSGTEKKYPHELSGGMKQRAALLRAYLFGSSILLLDEPFSALDPMTRADIHNWFLDISEKNGFSSFIITHDVEEAILLSDRIYVISGIPGKITDEIIIPKEQKKRVDFRFSSDFLEYKKKIMEILS